MDGRVASEPIPGPVERLDEQLRALDRAYSAGHHGRWSARRRADLVDGCVRALLERAEAPAGVRLAVVALGGYGRRELAPRSDIDLLLLHDGEPAAVAAVAEAVLYPLWDAGLEVGHAVRTIEDCLTFSIARLDAATAMLDARIIAGDPAPVSEMRLLVDGWVGEDPRGFAVRLIEARDARRERYGSVSYLLEPDLKEGVGGLRDVQSLGWLASVLGEHPDAPTLDGVGLLRAAERDAVDEAAEFLTRVRSALHLETGRNHDRLHLDQQPNVARAMGFHDEPGLSAVDALMRALFQHARQVEHATGAVFERFLGGDSSAGTSMPDSPESVLEAFASAAEEGRSLSPAMLDRIEGAALDPEIAWSRAMLDAFMRILRSGDGGVAALESMDRIGLLERFVPAWAGVRCRPQRDPYHRYTVDVHLLRATAEMSRLLDAPPAEDSVALQASGSVTDRDALLLGALLHDAGKVGEGNHVIIGVRVAEETLSHMGIDEPAAQLVRFLVAEHLLLSNTATRRDLTDADLILDVAARVETPERLAALYLLTVADAMATGPHAWTPWRQALVRELVGKVQRTFERGQMGEVDAERLDVQAGAVRARLADSEAAHVESFLRRMPRGYLLSVSVERIVEHAGMLAAPVGDSEVRTAVAAGRRQGIFDLTVMATDRPGLLSMVAGALSLAGLSILSAHVFTTDDGVAVDVFEVEGWFEHEVDEERWRSFRSVLRRAIDGRVSLADRVERQRATYPAPRSELGVQVDVDNQVSDLFTVVEVGAPDRIGLLFDITRTLAELDLDVHLAKVATYGERVIDAFYVRDRLGRKVSEPGPVEAIRSRLAERVRSPA